MHRTQRAYTANCQGRSSNTLLNGSVFAQKEFRKAKHTPNLVISLFFSSADVDKIKQTLTLIEAVRKQAEARAHLHLPIFHASHLKVFDICIGSDHDLRVVCIKLELLQMVLDSSMQLISSILASPIILVKEPLPELFRRDVSPAISQKSRFEGRRDSRCSHQHQHQSTPARNSDHAITSSVTFNRPHYAAKLSPSKSQALQHDSDAYDAQPSRYPDPTKSGGTPFSLSQGYR